MAERATRRRLLSIGVAAGLVTVVAAIAVWSIVSTGHGNSPLPAGGYFSTLAPGATLPSDAACAARVHRAPWEPRADNLVPNHTKPGHPPVLANDSAYNATWQAKYKTRITGNFTGTTDEIIQWAACKWGIADNMVRAQAVVESHWHMDTESDAEPRSNGHCAPGDTRDPCPTSFGILQIKWYFHPSRSPIGNSYPMSKTMTAFSLDDALASTRGCYDGLSFVGRRSTGDLLGCMGLWFSGNWHDSNANDYIGRVQRSLDARTWLNWSG